MLADRTPLLLALFATSSLAAADVIHVPGVASGRKLNVVMDGDTDRALAYLA